MRKRLLFVLCAAVLFLVPLAARWLYFYEGRYQPQKVARPDLSAIRVPTPETVPFEDRQASLEPGTILVDMAHENRFKMAELNVLQSRLAARGQHLELVAASEDLAGQLQYAQALIVISPGENWTPAEVQEVQAFVGKGGRLLLIADPTRFEILSDELGSYLGTDGDAPHINSLAARFDVLFQDDYLYNTVENEGNFRNIRLTSFADQRLSEGLEQVVFYAAHSITSDELALISADGETRSSRSERPGALPVAVLAADGAVLALGDLTFMTEPHEAMHDNDRLIANIADFLSGADREYELADFPFFFDDRVDLVYAGNPVLNSDLLAQGSALQTLFQEDGKELTLRAQEDKTTDALFLGLYDKAVGTGPSVGPYLTTAQITLWITPTEVAAREGSPTPAPTERVTASLPVTPTTTLTVTASIAASPEITVTADLTSTVKRLEIETFGDVVLTGTSLFLLQSEGERQVLVILSDSEAGLESAVQRLTEDDLEDCLFLEPSSSTAALLALCPTGETAPGKGGGGWEKPESEPPRPAATSAVTETRPVTDTVEPPPPAGRKSIFVVALDDGEARYDGLSGATEWAAVLKERYDVTVWSKKEKGPPGSEEYLRHDLVIWTAGDFDGALGAEENAILFELLLEEMPVVVSGAYIGDTDVESVQRDVRVNDEAHPLAKGFQREQVIRFVTGPSGEAYQIDVLDDAEGEPDAAVPFVRGPESEDEGKPSVLVLEEEASGVRIAFLGFPIYLLPEQAREQLALNTVDWLLGQ